MSNKIDTEYFKKKAFWKWQTDFAVSFLSDQHGPYWSLVSPTGSGKTRLAAGLIAYELEQKAARHILVITRSNVFLQDWKASILSLGDPFTNIENQPVVFDSRTFYELDAAANESKSLWQNQKIVILSVDLIRHKSLISSLVAINWDLVIFDDCTDAAIVDELFNALITTKKVARFLFLSQREIDNKKISNKLSRIVRISLEMLINQRKERDLEYSTGFIDYTPNEEEQTFFKSIMNFADDLEKTWDFGHKQRKIVLRVASSSIFATEQMLKRFQSNWSFLRNKIAHSMDLSYEDLERAQESLKMSADELGTRTFSSTHIHIANFLSLFSGLNHLISSVQDLSKDSKMDALNEYLRKIAPNSETCYICIVTSFANTARYIFSSIQELGIPVYSMTSSSSYEERKTIAEEYNRKGGILILTLACCQGLEFNAVETVIIYDEMPDSQRDSVILTRFLRLGRRNKIVILNLRKQLSR